MTRKSYKAGDEMLGYQRNWANDKSRFKFGLWSRQTGKDFCAAKEGIDECQVADARGEKIDWLIAAPSERQSLESLNKWKERAEANKFELADYKELRDGAEAMLKSATITFPHGSRVIAVPGKPDTVRGYSANVLLTEFAFFESPDATWRAILPSITNPLRGGLKKVRLITTPNGIGNKAHEIWSQNYKVKNAKWSCHFVDIYTAVADKLPVDIEELKAAVNDPEGWAQEFECQFLDAQAVLLPYELIATCETAEAAAVQPAEFWQTTPPWPVDIGIDFGRKHDLTVAWSNAALGDVAQTVEVLELAKMSTPDQIAILRPRIQRARRVCVDYTGPGIGMGDYLVKEFHEWKPDGHLYGKIELCTFSNPLKVDIFSKLRMAFEKRGVRVPISRAIREDLHSVNRVTTPAGGITYRAPRDAAGHADRCTALALAIRAGTDNHGTSCCQVFEESRINTALDHRRERFVEI